MALVSSCIKESSVHNNNNIVIDKFPNEENIKFENLIQFRNGEPKRIFLEDSTLVIYSTSSKADHNFLYNYDLRSNNISEGYLKKGRSYGEIFGGFSMGVDENLFWIHDISLSKVLTLDITQVSRSENPDQLEYIEYPIGQFFHSISSLENNRYLGVGSYDSKSKIQKLDLKNNILIEEFGSFDNPPEGIPFTAFKAANIGKIFVQPSKDKAVILYKYSDAIEIFDLNKKQGLLISGPENFEAKYKPILTGGTYVAGLTPETRYGFIQGHVTDSFIYVLYSGRLFESDNFSSGKTIYVYDWQGNPVKKLNLDTEIKCFTVTENNDLLIAFDRNKNYIVTSKLNK